MTEAAFKELIIHTEKVNKKTNRCIITGWLSTPRDRKKAGRVMEPTLYAQGAGVGSGTRPC